MSIIITNEYVVIYVSAEPVVSILSLTESVYVVPYTLTCQASFIPKIASQLIQYLVLEWTGPDGVSLSEENGVIIEQQQTRYSEATRSLTFHPLNMTHGGEYTCKASLLLPDTPLLPDTSSAFNSSSSYNLNVLSKQCSIHVLYFH